MRHRLDELAPGVRVVSETLPAVRSVALGFWIGTGSRGERDPEAGLSHLIEHLLFRGSERYGPGEADRIFDAMGAELNAATGKEATEVYARVLDERLEQALDVIADMVWRPSFADLDLERQVVLEEIAMQDDDPQEKVFDLLGEAIFGSHPLGRPVIGRAAVVRDTPPDAIRAFHRTRYGAPNVVVAAAGSVDHERLVALVSERLRDTPSQPAPAPQPLQAAQAPASGLRFERKDTEQVHLCLGGRGIAREDERRFALRVLDAVLGGTASSRLFREVRERRGLAYAVHTFADQYEDGGEIGLYLGTRADNLAQALEVVAAELERIRREPLAPEELDRARESLKGRTVLALESTGARMQRLGTHVLAGMPLLELDELIERIDAVSAADVAALAGELLAPQRLSAAAIGPDESLVQAALAPLGLAPAGV